MESLGFDWKILVIQLINFGVLYVVLKKFLYTPILKLLDDRKKGIEKSLSDSKKIEVELAKLEEQKNKILDEAKKDSNKLKDEMVRMASEEKRKILEEAKKISDQEMESARKKIEALQEETFTILKKKFLEETVNETLNKISKNNNSKDQLLKSLLK